METPRSRAPRLPGVVVHRATLPRARGVRDPASPEARPPSRARQSNLRWSVLRSQAKAQRFYHKALTLNRTGDPPTICAPFKHAQEPPCPWCREGPRYVD